MIWGSLGRYDVKYRVNNFNYNYTTHRNVNKQTHHSHVAETEESSY